ncbi:MAG: putative nicotinamide N-methyase [Rhodothermales bacterium]|jgi:predicted nicotinamide N-methyase
MNDELESRFNICTRTYEIAGRSLEFDGVADPNVVFDDFLDNGSEESHRDERMPYWAEVWTSSLVLGQHILNGAISPVHSVIELGCGIGITGTVAGFVSQDVLLTDYEEPAIGFAARNWRRHHASEPQTALLDWRDPPRTRRYDRIIAADVAYESRAFRPLADTFDALLEPGGEIIFGEPHRPIAGEFYMLLRNLGWEIARDSIPAPEGTKDGPVWVVTLTRS